MKKVMASAALSSVLTMALSPVAGAADIGSNGGDAIRVVSQAQDEHIVGFIKNQRFMIPLRALVKSLTEENVVWDREARTAIVTIGKNVFHFQIDSEIVQNNGTPFRMNEKVVIRDGVTYIPASAIARLFSVDVEWEDTSKSVTISKSIASKAISVLESLESGDPDAIRKYVSAETYIQHNLEFTDGREGLLGALNTLKEAGTRVEVKRVLTDGNYVALHTDYDIFGEKAGFDIFRFEDGKIVEHWDNLQLKTAPNPSGRTLLDGQTEIKDVDKTEENKQMVKRFVEDVLMGQNPEALTSYFDGDNYIQHNPYIGDGLSGLGAALAEWAEQGVTMQYDTIHMVIGQGNFVLVVSEGYLGGAHTSFYDLFRVESGKIAEHWDTLETIPPKDEWKNENGKF